jgi:receptor tyrosine kinase-like orphan receptor 1
MKNQTVFISPETTMEMLEEKLARAYGVIKESKDMNSICSNFAVPSLCITVLPICRTPEETNHYFFLNKNKAKAVDKFITKKAKKSNQKKPKPKAATSTKIPPTATSTTTSSTAQPHIEKDIEFSGNSNSYYEPDSYHSATEHPFNHLRKRRNIDIDFLSIKNAYPPTKYSENLRRICRSDCELLENEICQKEYAIAKRHPTIGQILPLEDCNEVPDDDDCLRMGINIDISPSESCYWDNGNQYRGTKDKSINGKACLKWSKALREITHIELANNNYCRNPDGSQTKPWCYVDKQKTVELCDIQKCSDKMWFIIICALILFLMTTMCITICVCCKKMRRQSVSNIQNVSSETKKENVTAMSVGV